MEKEGLFDPSLKRPLPFWVRRVAVITSATGAAIRDILKVAYRRRKHLHMLVVPASVQGEQAPGELKKALNMAFDYHRSPDTPPLDAIIIGRGGGSLEDLWAFNDESLARMIRSSPVPVVSAVGHEIDFTICDFVADVRAATPSAAAERVTTPTEREIYERIEALQRKAVRSLEQLIEHKKLHILHLSRRLISPAQRLKQLKERVALLETRLEKGIEYQLSLWRERLQRLSHLLQSCSPLAVLGRGYSITRDSRGKTLYSVASLQKGDRVHTYLREGSFYSRVEEIQPIRE